MIVVANTTPLNYLVLIERCDRNARVLTEAADRGLIDFSDTIAQLRQTSFYVSPEVLNPLLQRYAKKR